MKKSTLLLLLTCGMILSAHAQSFQIGQTTITFNDPSRTGGFGSGGGAGRQIQSEIYYPSQTAGTDVALSSGNFPVIVFGHGFVMAWDAYQNIWEELVPEGYIMVFPRTEGGFSPSHDEFALDLALIVNEMQLLNTDNLSLFYQHLNGKSAIMGHSMGGGASILAAENNTNIETVIGLAPAETTPSAISSAANISVPALIFSGSSDGVTPPVDHHLPIYNSLNSGCKYFISATGGAHCYFANSNFNCDFGEGTSSSGISISRLEQHAILFYHLKPWLAFKLKGDCIGFTNFQSGLPNDTSITYLEDCNLSSPIISSAGSLNLCFGDSVELYSSSNLDWNTGENGPFIYASTTGDYFGYDSNCQVSNSLNVSVNSLDSTEQNISICFGDSVVVGPNTYYTSGVYYDNFTNSFGCDSTVKTEITVNSSLNVSIAQSNDSLLADLQGLNYQWIDCDNANQLISGANGNFYVPNSSGNFAVIVNSGSCVDTSDCLNYSQSLSFNDVNISALRVYPNPTESKFIIEHPLADHYSIYSLQGKLIMSGMMNNSITCMITEPGIYLIKVSLKTGKNQIEKLIIAQ